MSTVDRGVSRVKVTVEADGKRAVTVVEVDRRLVSDKNMLGDPIGDNVAFAAGSQVDVLRKLGARSLGPVR